MRSTCAACCAKSRPPRSQLLRGFDAWLKKVFNLFGLVAGQPEGRQHPRHLCVEVFTALLLGAAGQMGSLPKIGAACRWEPSRPLRLMRRATAHSYRRCCTACLERRVERKVAGQIETAVEYCHRLVMVVVVSGPLPIPLGLRFQQPGETELACALALLEDLIAQLGRRYFDILVADALYLQAPFIGRLEQLGLRWVISLNNNQPDLAASAERLMAGPAQGSEPLPDGQLEYWYLPELYWPAADRAVVLLKTAWRCGLRHTLTVDCHLMPAGRHRPTGLPICIMIRMLAYALSLLFYHRQLLSHAGQGTPASFREFARALRQLAPALDSR